MKNLDLKQFADENRLPIMDSIQFKNWTDEIGKEKFRELLAEYIAEHRPVFPLKQISYDDMRNNMLELSRFDTSKICTPKEQIEKEVFEKYDDYKYNFKEYGLGIIDSPSTYNKCSNYFHQHLRLNCSSWSFACSS